MGKIPDGCIFIARKLQESEIWEDKPSWWLKVWIYLIMEVNFTDTKKYKRGQGFFRMSKIYEDCHLYNDSIKVRSLTNLFQWLKKMTQIKTQKMTHGVVITICNYEEYQNLLHYRNDTENEKDSQSEMKWKRNENDTNIDKNANKNAKELDNTITADTQKTAEDKNSNRESKPTSPQEVETAPGNGSGIPGISGTEAKGRQTRKKATNPEVKQFIDFAYQEHKKKFGLPFHVAPGKDGELVSNLLGTYSLDALKKLYLKLLDSDDAFINQAGRGINIFYSTVNKLVSGCRDIKDIQGEKNKRLIEESRRRMAAKGHEV